MISQMDQVYANASVTIIAAAGDNVQMGLPGVSNFPRQRQQWANIKNTTLLELPYGEDDLLSSKWASRGWTYQEGYLSTRRVIFTPRQLLFLCNKQYLEEYGHVLLKDQFIPPFRLLDKLSSIFPTSNPTGVLSTSSVLRQIEQYSLRELSYSSDSFNAFRGILNYYTSGRFIATPATHLAWGLIAEKARSEEGLCVYLNWYHHTPAKRRYEFPSWAWTGWDGPLTFGEGILVRDKVVHRRSFVPLPELSWEVSFEAECGKTMEISDFASICSINAHVGNSGLHSRSSESSPRRLLITCQLLPIQFRKVNLTKAQRDQKTMINCGRWTGKIRRPNLVNSSLAVLEVREGIYIGSRYHLDQDLEQKDCVMGLVFLSRHGSEIFFEQIGCLMVRQVKDGFYERVGLLHNMSLTPMRKTLSPLIFFDEMGTVMDRIEIPDGAYWDAFTKVGERKTICLL